MAVKTSWSSGDVLTAADLTDTFAAKGDVAGETWTGTHDFTGATVSGVGGGTSLVVAQSFTSASTISVDNCFTSTYDNYRIMLQYSASAAADLSFRFRASSTDDTTSVYNLRGWKNTASSVAAIYDIDQTSCKLLGGTTVANMVIADIMDPATTRYPQGMFTAHQGYAAVSDQAWSGTFGILKASSFDGFSLILSTGNATGVVSVYGFAKS